MPKPAKDEPQNPDTPAHWSRLAARLSAASAFICFAVNCVGKQLLLKNPQQSPVWIWTAMDVVSAGIITTGIVAGFAGLYGGIRKKCSDTIGIALIGLFLHGGILFVALWLRAALKAHAG